MSTVSGISSKGDTKNNTSSSKDNNASSKASFATLNINNLYRGKSLEQSKAPAPKHGMQTIGKLGNIRRMPAPSSLSSLSKETDLKVLSNKETKVSSNTSDKQQSSSDQSSKHSVVGSSSSSSTWNQANTSSVDSTSLSKPVETKAPLHAGQTSWTAGGTKADVSFPALGADVASNASDRRQDSRPLQTKRPILPPTEFPELGTSLEEDKTVAAKDSRGQQTVVQKQTDQNTSLVSLPTQPTSATASDASYGPGPSLRPPPVNWNQRNNTMTANPSVGMNGSGSLPVVVDPKAFPPHLVLPASVAASTAFPAGVRGQQTTSGSLGSSQFAAQRSGYHGGGGNQSNVGNQDFRGARSKSSKEEVPAKFKASIIPTEKISEFDEILEKGEMKIDWTSACDDIDYEEELIFDLDEAAKKAKSTPSKPKVEDSSQTSTQSAKITTERHPSFEDEFKRGQSNPSSRVLYDPRDGKQKHMSSMTARDRDGGQRPRRDSRSMSEKSDEGPVPPRGGIRAEPSRGQSTRDSRNAPPAGMNPRDAPRGTSFPGPPQSQLAPRFQRQLQNEQMNDKRDQPRSGMTSLGTVRQRPIQEVKQFDAETDNRRRPDNFRNDSQVLNHSSKQQEDRWRSKGDELNWRNQAKKVDPQQNQQRTDSTKKPDQQKDNIIILKHEDKPDVDKDRGSQVDQESPGKLEARDPRLRNTSFSDNTSNVRNNPPAPPGLLNQARVRPEESSWRNKSDADRRQDKSDSHRREQESNRNDQFQGKVDERTNTRRDSDTNRRGGKPDERQGDNRQNDQLRSLNRGDDHHFEKQMQDLSLDKNKVVGPSSVFQESKTAPRLPSEPAFRSSNIIQTGLKKDVPEATGMAMKSSVVASGPVLARVLAGSNYGPPPSKAAFETLSKPLSQSSSLEHQDSGVDVGPDHPASAASSQRSSPGGAGDKRPGGQRVVFPANTSLIGKSVEPAEPPKGIVIFENQSLRAENAALEKGHRKPVGPGDNNDPRRQRGPVSSVAPQDERNRPGYSVKSMEMQKPSVRELGQDLDQKIASVRKVWEDTTPPPPPVSSSSGDKMSNSASFSGDTRSVHAGQAAAVAAIRGIVNDTLARQNQQQQQQQQQFRRSSASSASASPPVHHLNQMQTPPLESLRQQQHSHPGSIASPPTNIFQHQPNQQQQQQQQQPVLTNIANMVASLQPVNHHVYSPQLQAFAQQMVQFNQQQLRAQQQTGFSHSLAGSVPAPPASHDSYHRVNPAGTIGHPNMASNVSHNHSETNVIAPPPGHGLAPGGHLMKHQSQQQFMASSAGHQGNFPASAPHGFYGSSQNSSASMGFYSSSMTNTSHPQHSNQGYSANYSSGHPSSLGLNPAILASSMSSSDQHQQQQMSSQFRGMMPVPRGQNNRPF